MRHTLCLLHYTLAILLFAVVVVAQAEKRELHSLRSQQKRKCKESSAFSPILPAPCPLQNTGPIPNPGTRLNPRSLKAPREQVAHEEEDGEEAEEEEEEEGEEEEEEEGEEGERGQEGGEEESSEYLRL